MISFGQVSEYGQKVVDRFGCVSQYRKKTMAHIRCVDDYANHVSLKVYQYQSKEKWHGVNGVWSAYMLEHVTDMI